MAATLSFRWLEILEKEFDKAFVDLDLLLGEIDPDQCELTYEGRQKMTALSAAFAQLCHKAQTIFQSNAKVEVRVMSDLCRNIYAYVLFWPPAFIIIFQTLRKIIVRYLWPAAINNFLSSVLPRLSFEMGQRGESL